VTIKSITYSGLGTASFASEIAVRSIDVTLSVVARLHQFVSSVFLINTKTITVRSMKLYLFACFLLNGTSALLRL